MQRDRWIEYALFAAVLSHCLSMNLSPNHVLQTLMVNAEVALAFFHLWRYELIPLYVLAVMNAGFLGLGMTVPVWFAWLQGTLCVLGLLVIWLFPLPLFPSLSSSHPSVGCTTMRLNGLDCRVFYPAIQPTKAARTPYLHHGRHLAIGLNKFVPHIPQAFFSSFQNGRLNARLNAPLKTAPSGGWPVVVFSHGLGGAIEMYSSYCQYVASEGMIVVALNHTDGSASVYRNPDNQTFQYYDRPPASALADWAGEGYFIRNRQLKKRAKQMQLVLDAVVALNKDRSSEFYQQIDVDRLAVAGHSFGGATALTTAHLDKRVKAVVGLDIWMQPLDKEVVNAGLAVPICSIISHGWLQWASHLETMQKYMYKSQHPQKAFLAIEKTRHNNFCDLPLFSPTISWAVKAAGSINPTYGLDISSQLMAVYLRQQFYAGTAFNTMHHKFPEVI
ncbi:unnamed protein product [Aphanomyces euteiches]